MAGPRCGQLDFRTIMGAQGSDSGEPMFSRRRVWPRSRRWSSRPDRVVSLNVGFGQTLRRKSEVLSKSEP